jgi:hypothetical protein
VKLGMLSILRMALNTSLPLVFLFLLTTVLQPPDFSWIVGFMTVGADGPPRGGSVTLDEASHVSNLPNSPLSEEEDGKGG